MNKKDSQSSTTKPPKLSKKLMTSLLRDDFISWESRLSHGLGEESDITFFQVIAKVNVFDSWAIKLLSDHLDANNQMIVGKLEARAIGRGDETAFGYVLDNAELEGDYFRNAVASIFRNNIDESPHGKVNLTDNVFLETGLEGSFPKGIAYISDIEVEEGFRSNGIGSGLLREFSLLSEAYASVTVIEAFPVKSVLSIEGDKPVELANFNADDIKRVRNFYLKNGFMDAGGSYNRHMFAEKFSERFVCDKSKSYSSVYLDNKSKILSVDNAIKQSVQDLESKGKDDLSYEWHHIDKPGVRENITERLNIACQFINPNAYAALHIKDEEAVVPAEVLMKNRKWFSIDNVKLMPAEVFLPDTDKVADAPEVKASRIGSVKL